MSEINPLNSNSLPPQNISGTSPLVYDLIHKKISKEKVSKLLENMALVAYSLGETNEPKKYAQEMGAHVFDALDDYIKSKKKKNKKDQKN